jgi:thiamine biosynthesis lipoprotein ApbE
VTDALATAFMLLSDECIEQLCERSPGLEAWIVEDATAPYVDDRVRHYGVNLSNVASGFSRKDA